jgi:hypothetical protein
MKESAGARMTRFPKNISFCCYLFQVRILVRLKKSLSSIVAVVLEACRKSEHTHAGPKDVRTRSSNGMSAPHRMTVRYVYGMQIRTSEFALDALGM